MVTGPARKKTSKWLLGCGIGCGVIVFLMVGAAGTGIFYVSRVSSGFDDAMASRDALEEAYGTRESYTPAPDGAIAPERMEAFLLVRTALTPLCMRFESTFGRFEELDGDQDVDAKDIFGVIRSAWGIVPLMAEFFRTRNESLVAAEMSLGEYSYIYVLAFHSFGLESEDAKERCCLDGNVQKAFIGYLEHQTAIAPEEEQPALAAESAALAADPKRIPWQDGLPAPIRASLEPYRDRLQSAYCEAAEDLELERGNKNGMTFTAD